ncbi:AlpA family phage regulatory protein [Aminobacter sp. BE322]|uniref:AlpA family phage regulatory protein n=1 Tax=unclassified Aminobacter TaxID=2644704 RepID=UPI003D1C0326
MRTFIRRQQVERITGLCTSTIYEGMRLGWFPKAIQMGPRAVAWDVDEITEWQERAIARRDSTAA